jgi:hypothetical protein
MFQFTLLVVAILSGSFSWGLLILADLLFADRPRDRSKTPSRRRRTLAPKLQ